MGVIGERSGVLSNSDEMVLIHGASTLAVQPVTYFLLLTILDACINRSFKGGPFEQLAENIVDASAKCLTASFELSSSRP